MGPSSSRPTQPTSDGARLSRSGTPATTSAPSSAAMVAACLRQYERPIATTAWSGHQDVGQVLERLSTYSQRVASWRRHADAAQRSGAAGDAGARSAAGRRERRRNTALLSSHTLSHFCNGGLSDLARGSW